MATDRKIYKLDHPDLHPELVVERGPQDRGVGWWVPEVKHRLLGDFVEATWAPRSRYQNRVFVDLFSGPGRVQVEGEEQTRDGGALVAWRQSQRKPEAAFTQVIVGDANEARASACAQRLRSASAPVIALPGPAATTVAQAVRHIPRSGSLVLAYLDPYNLQHLSFNIIAALAKLPKVDFIVHFSTMDLTRNIELEFARERFDDFAPGWKQAISPESGSARTVREALFEYWCGRVRQLGFTFSMQQPLIKADGNKPLYRLLAFSRSPLPNKIWSDVAKPETGSLF